MNEKFRKRLPTNVGAMIGFLLFALYGAVPGVLYGGFVGKELAESMLGEALEPAFFAKLVEVGGMAFGLLSSLFLFLILFALAGTLVGTLMGYSLGPDED